MALIGHHLQKKDSSTTRKLCIVTLTKIFSLTRSHQSLVREITTPSLPGFITSCLNLAKFGASNDVWESNVRGSLTHTVLQALVELLPNHPTSFRPFVAQIRSMILPLLACTPSDVSNQSKEDNRDVLSKCIPKSMAQDARRLFVLLTVCAPKNTCDEEWARLLHTVVDTTHKTADLVCRAIYEDWDISTRRLQAGVVTSRSSAEIVNDQDAGLMGLPGWNGIHAGLERLNGLLQTLQSFLSTPMPATITLPVGAILDLLNRLLSVLQPLNSSNSRLNPEIGRDEREGLWIGLPQTHVSAMEVLSLLVSRLGQGFASLAHGVLEEILWVFQREYTDYEIRRTTYGLATQILTRFGHSLPKSLSHPLAKCIKSCCEDLLPSYKEPTIIAAIPANGTKKSFHNGSSIDADSFLKPTKADLEIVSASTELQTTAAIFLSVTLSSLPHSFLSFSIRTQIDRTAVLTQNKQSMIASVLNPPTKRKGGRESSSIMPLLARSFPECMEVEALIRPRMPVLQQRRNEIGEIESDDENMDIIREFSNSQIDRGLDGIPTVQSGSTNAMQESPEVVLPSMHETDQSLPTQQPLQHAAPKLPEFQPTSHDRRKRDNDAIASDGPPSFSIDPKPPRMTTLSDTSLDPTMPTQFHLAYSQPSTSSSKRAKIDSAHADDHLTPSLSSIQPPQPPTLIADSSTAQPAELGDNVTDSSDDENFVIPTIDIEMDTEDGGDEEEELDDDTDNK